VSAMKLIIVMIVTQVNVIIRTFSRILMILTWDCSLALQRRRTFKLLRSPRTEEIKFPTSSASVCIRGIDLRFHTCHWMPYVV